MAMEVKELLKAAGLPEDIDSIDKFVEQHNNRFVPISEAHTHETVVKKVTGKIYGPLNNVLKKTFELGDDDLKDKKFEDILSIHVEGLRNKITELSSDDKVKPIQTELEKVKGERNQYKETLDNVVKEKTELETNFNGKLKAYKLESVIKDAKGKLAFKDGVKEVEKAGFDAIVANKYVFDYDDEEKPIVKTRDGKRVPDPKKSGSFLDIEAVLDMELTAAELKKMNSLNGGQKFQFTQNNNGNNNGSSGNNGDAKPKVHPKAMRQAEMVAGHRS